MKFAVLLILFVSTACGKPLYYDTGELNSYKLFEQYMYEHETFYENPYERSYRYKIFRQNLFKINQLNEEYSNVGTEFGINSLADLAPEEFKAKLLMRPAPAPEFPPTRYAPRPKLRYEDLPKEFDWTSKGKVTPVKNQGSTGTCWAFSTVGNIEGQWAMMGQPLTNFSVEQIVDCDDMKDIPRMYADCGVFGGWPYLAYQYVMKAGGLETEEDYPYCCGIGGGPGSCFICQVPTYNASLCGPPVWWCNSTCADRIDPSRFHKRMTVQNWTAISQNETDIAADMLERGPLSVALDATLLQFYRSGVFNPPNFACNPKTLNHAVLLTGFGTTKSVFGSDEPYWIVKNSWGPKWGIKGYFWIRRGDGKCGINTSVTSAILKPVK